MAAVIGMKTRPITPAFGVEILDIELPRLSEDLRPSLPPVIVDSPLEH